MSRAQVVAELQRIEQLMLAIELELTKLRFRLDRINETGCGAGSIRALETTFLDTLGVLSMQRAAALREMDAANDPTLDSPG